MGQQPALAFPRPGEGSCGAAQCHGVLPGRASPPRPHVAHHELTTFSRRLWRYAVLLREPHVPAGRAGHRQRPAPGLGGSRKSSGLPQGTSHSHLLPLSQCRCPLQLRELLGQRRTACKNWRKVQFVDCTNTISKPTAGTTELEHRTNTPDQKNNRQ